MGHAWLLQTDWLRYLWWEKVPSWDCCEDQGLSASAYLHGGIRTVVPPMSVSRYSTWGDSVGDFHSDLSATFKRTIPMVIRTPLMRFWLSHGWLPVMARDRAHICTEMSPACLFAYDFFFSSESPTRPLHLSVVYPGTRHMLLVYPESKRSVCQHLALHTAIWNQTILITAPTTDKLSEATSDLLPTLSEVWLGQGCQTLRLHSPEEFCSALRPWMLYGDMETAHFWTALSCSSLVEK